MIRLNATAIPLPVPRWADGNDYSHVSYLTQKRFVLVHTSGVYAYTGRLLVSHVSLSDCRRTSVWFNLRVP